MAGYQGRKTKTPIVSPKKYWCLLDASAGVTMASLLASKVKNVGFLIIRFLNVVDLVKLIHRLRNYLNISWRHELDDLIIVQHTA